MCEVMWCGVDARLLFYSLSIVMVKSSLRVYYDVITMSFAAKVVFYVTTRDVRDMH